MMTGKNAFWTSLTDGVWQCDINYVFVNEETAQLQTAALSVAMCTNLVLNPGLCSSYFTTLAETLRDDRN
jgi:hypothetical protein